MKLCRKGLHDKDDPANVRVHKDGRTQCKPCMLEAHRRRNAERRLADPEFRERENARAREWANENRAYRDEYEAEWRANNPDQMRLRRAADYRKHRDKRLSAGEQWRKENRERLNELVREWRKANPDRRAAIQRRRRARKLGAPTDDHSRADVLERWGHTCWLCDQPLPEKWHEDHVVPLSLGGSDLLENCRPACPPCNLRKGAKLVSR